MIIPNRSWKFNEFQKYLLENTRNVLGDSKRRWLKMYYVYMDDNALENLKNTMKPEILGDLLKFEFEYTPTVSEDFQHVPFYMVQLEPGLFCFYTSSTRKSYENTLRRVIRRTRGMSEMWIRPELFEKIKDFVIENGKTKIEGFLSLSSSNAQTDARVRPFVKRQIRYRGSDGNDAVNELKSWYGVSPVSLDFIHKKSKFQITHEGLFTLKHLDGMIFEIIDNALELIREEQVKQKNIALKLKFETSTVDHVNTAHLESGKIHFKTIHFEDADARSMISKFASNFAFIDTYSKQDISDFSATVIDKHKGSVFDISIDESNIIIVPKFETTYETFLNFYREIVETFDHKATLQVYS